MTASKKSAPKTPYRYVLLPGALLFGLVMFASCEDDPIVEPKGGAKTGGSYGRMAPATWSDTGKDPKAPEATLHQNPELF